MGPNRGLSGPASAAIAGLDGESGHPPGPSESLSAGDAAGSVAGSHQRHRSASDALKRRFARACTGRSRRGVTLCRAPTGLGIAAEGVPQVLLERLLADPEAPIHGGLDRPVKLSHGSVLVEAGLPLGGCGGRVAYKQYRPRNWWKGCCNLLRRSRARRDWAAARRLVALGIPTARPVLVLEPRQFRLRRRSYLATEWIVSSENLHLYAWKLAELPLGERLGRAARCAESLGRLIGRLHARGIAHRDLKGANLLVTDQGHGIETCLVDVAGVRFLRRLSRRRRAKNLARLAVGLSAHRWVPRTACCRFLRNYLRELPPEAADWKRLWREAAADSQRLRAKMQGRGEPLL